MPRFSPFALITLLLLAFAGAVFGQTFGAVLTPGQENPPTTATGFGTATVTLDPTHTSLTVTITISGIGTSITGAHIHGEGGPTENKPVLVGFVPGATFVNGKMTTTVTVDKTMIGDRIAAHPELFYVNVQGEAWAEDKEIATGSYMQVDVWSKGDFTVIVAQVKTLLENAGLRRTYTTEMYEIDTLLYHKVLRFSYVTNTI